MGITPLKEIWESPRAKENLTINRDSLPKLPQPAIVTALQT